MTFKMKTSAIALVLLGATALSSCSTWYPGKGYKLYKSPTEGNMIVTLVNVSLTPNKSLGRIIADFSY